MNRDQMGKLVRWAVTAIAMFVAGQASAKGVDLSWVQNLFQSEVVIGFLTTAAMGGWAWLSGRLPNLIALIDGLAKDPSTPIVGVITAQTVEGAQLAKVNDTAVMAGTPEAAKLAKAV